MVRDFLDHLLLELRVQHSENLQSLRSLEGKADFSEAIEASAQTSPNLIEQFKKYHAKYETALLFADAIDNRGATEAETRDVAVAMLNAATERRDEQIGHMEALQELFDEAVMCARTPFGVSADGNAVQPIRSWPVREIINGYAETPDFNELAAAYEDHPYTNQEFIEHLRAAKVIVATHESFVRPRILFGKAALEACANGEGGTCEVLDIRVDGPEDLQFLVATIAKCKGQHDYGGNYYDEF
jgi:hypothetical protein